MTECQGCGAWNDTSRTLCVLCGTPLAGTDEWDAAAELPPLPPLPDGGLRASMPTWLRERPALTISGPLPIASPAVGQVVDLAPLGSRADPRTFLIDDDFPPWLHDLAMRETAPRARAADTNDSATATASSASTERLAPAVWPGSPAPALLVADAVFTAPGAEQVIPDPAPMPEPAPAPVRDGQSPPAITAARVLTERHRRDAWEMLLLGLLFIGIITAAVWALVSNGVFSPSL